MLSSFFATILPPLICSPLSPQLPPASCPSLGGLSWSEPIKLQWEAAWRKHGCSVALLSINYIILMPDSRGPISSPTALWPHVGPSQTYKLTLHTPTAFDTDTYTHKGQAYTNPYIILADILLLTHFEPTRLNLWPHVLSAACFSPWRNKKSEATLLHIISEWVRSAVWHRAAHSWTSSRLTAMVIFPKKKKNSTHEQIWGRHLTLQSEGVIHAHSL